MAVPKLPLRMMASYKRQITYRQYYRLLDRSVHVVPAHDKNFVRGPMMSVSFSCFTTNVSYCLFLKSRSTFTFTHLHSAHFLLSPPTTAPSLIFRQLIVSIADMHHANPTISINRSLDISINCPLSQLHRLSVACELNFR
jgi:hypothetical protein